MLWRQSPAGTVQSVTHHLVYRTENHMKKIDQKAVASPSLARRRR